MKSENFGELAALYALDLLDADDTRLVEDDICQYPELDAELAEFRAAVAAMPYSTPVMPVAANLKQRLFDRLAAEETSLPGTLSPAEGSVALPYVSISDLTEQAAQVSWEPQPVPGVEIAKVHVDTDNREIAFFLRASDGIEFPKHKHASHEEIYVLEGDLSLDGQPYSSGDCIRSVPGSAHTPATQAGCLIFVRTSLDDETLGED